MKLTVAEGETLWEALKEQHIAVERPCGGRGSCGQCRVNVRGRGNVLSCQFREPGEYEIEAPDARRFSTLSHTLADGAEESPDSGAFAGETPQIAVDIGTTTVALVGTWRGKRVVKSFVNPQRSYGADVVSRIGECCRGNAENLRAALKEKLTEALCAAAEELTGAAGGACRAAVGANTAMLHILRGFSCEGLGRYPFCPVELSAGEESWEAGGYRFAITYFPGISAYIGADIVSGIYGIGMDEAESPVLLIDLGTNGEMALGNREKLLCASAAAGPAFEGSALALQLHASGILAHLHRMKDAGVMDAYGLLADPYFEEGYPVRCGDGASVRIRQEDIREIQMAKGAIRAGVDLLLKRYGVAAADVERVYLAGGMGYYLDPADAIAIGLLPEEFAGKLTAAGNTCLLGIGRYFKEEPGEALLRLSRIAGTARELILAQDAEFEERYLEAMNL